MSQFVLKKFSFFLKMCSVSNILCNLCDSSFIEFSYFFAELFPERLILFCKCWWGETLKKITKILRTNFGELQMSGFEVIQFALLLFSPSLYLNPPKRQMLGKENGHQFEPVKFEIAFCSCERRQVRIWWNEACFAQFDISRTYGFIMLLIEKTKG